VRKSLPWPSRIDPAFPRGMAMGDDAREGLTVLLAEARYKASD
jgi:hypothetical protein